MASMTKDDMSFYFGNPSTFAQLDAERASAAEAGRLDAVVQDFRLLANNILSSDIAPVEKGRQIALLGQELPGRLSGVKEYGADLAGRQVAFSAAARLEALSGAKETSAALDRAFGHYAAGLVSSGVEPAEIRRALASSPQRGFKAAAPPMVRGFKDRPLLPPEHPLAWYVNPRPTLSAASPAVPAPAFDALHGAIDAFASRRAKALATTINDVLDPSAERSIEDAGEAQRIQGLVDALMEVMKNVLGAPDRPAADRRMLLAAAAEEFRSRLQAAGEKEQGESPLDWYRTNGLFGG